MSSNQRIADIQEIIEDILDAPTGIRRKSFDRGDFNKLYFCRIIDNIEQLVQRTFFMKQDFGMDMSKYDETFFDTIDMLLEVKYNAEELKLINFYLYGKYDSDGTINQFIDESTNEVIILDTSEDLYYAIEDLNPKN